MDKELDLFLVGEQIRDLDPVEADELGFGARCLVEAALPYRHPKPEQLKNGMWVRRNGDYTLAVQGGVNGIPYGSYPRLFTIWLTGEARRTHSRDINAGNSFRAFCRNLGIDESMGKRGGRARLAEQITRLLCSRISFQRSDISVGGDHGESVKRTTEFLSITDQFDEFWAPQNPNQLALFDWHILLTQKFYDEIVEQRVPIDMRAIRALKSRPLALDIYQWLAYRMYNMSGPSAKPTWAQLHWQFGSQHTRLRNFKAEFISALRDVYAVYPKLRVEPQPGGLLMLKSPTPVPKLTIVGR